MVLSLINKFSYKPLFVLGAYAGLFLPDIDLLLLITRSKVNMTMIRHFDIKRIHIDAKFQH